MLTPSLGPLLAMFLASALPQCAPIEGVDAILGNPSLRWLVVGEMHGTREAPASFGDLVCAASQHGRKVVVALEYPIAEQERIDAFLVSDGSPGARSRLLSSSFWQSGKDGRSSGAALLLLDRLRSMKQAGAITGVVAIQPSGRNVSAANYEKEMARLVRQASVEDALTIALVGNAHAQIAPRPSAGGTDYMAMAGLLRRDQTKALLTAGNGGAAWNCQTSGSVDGKPDCAAHPLDQPRKQYPRGINLIGGSGARYDGYLNVGRPFTASPPAVGFATR